MTGLLVLAFYVAVIGAFFGFAAWVGDLLAGGDDEEAS